MTEVARGAGVGSTGGGRVQQCFVLLGSTNAGLAVGLLIFRDHDWSVVRNLLVALLWLAAIVLEMWVLHRADGPWVTSMGEAGMPAALKVFRGRWILLLPLLTTVVCAVVALIVGSLPLGIPRIDGGRYLLSNHGTDTTISHDQFVEYLNGFAVLLLMGCNVLTYNGLTIYLNQRGDRDQRPG